MTDTAKETHMADAPPREGGFAVAPDATEEERASVQDILRRGPQPIHTPEASAEQIMELRREVHQDREAPDMTEAVERERHRRQQEDVVTAPMEPAEAAASLAIMLSAEAPPPQSNVKSYEIPRLTRQYRDEGKLPPDQRFIVTVRGLTRQEYELSQDAALREPTPQERDRGVRGPIQDSNILNRIIVAMACLEVNDERVRTRFGPKSIDVVYRWFNTGETAMLTNRIMELTGFTDDAVVAAKE